MAAIDAIVYQPLGQGYDRHRDAFIRVPVQRANLVANHGIEGDRKAGRHPNRQLSLISREWLAGLEAHGYQTEAGQFGEQVILSGLDMTNLPVGTRLQLGETACIEISQPRTGCQRLESAQGRPVEGLGPIGVMACVITGGPIAVGDPVIVLETSAAPGWA